MSSVKKAYGWSGHILVSADDFQADVDANVVAVLDGVFDRIVHNYEHLYRNERIEIKRLGVLDSDNYIFAAGSRFSKGFEFYGTVFEHAEAMRDGQPMAIDLDADYLAAMKEIYGLDLPPCKLMVGCSSET